jgi:hypothetical protein
LRLHVLHERARGERGGAHPRSLESRARGAGLARRAMLLRDNETSLARGFAIKVRLEWQRVLRNAIRLRRRRNAAGPRSERSYANLETSD